MSDSTKKRIGHTVRRPSSARDAVSAVKMSERLTAEVDAFAEAHGMARADAICRLIEIGLSSGPADEFISTAATDPLGPEDLATKRINQLLDPSLPLDERERRIRRLIEGPPEFSGERVDLPKPRK